MELKIFNPQEGGFLQAIDWNYEELKKEIESKVDDYKNLVYSDDQIKEAKTDRANLNKFITALEDKRKEIKKQIMIPYTGFETKEKDLVNIINAAVTNIDTQIKGYEEKLRQEKTEKVRTIYLEYIGELESILPFERVFKPQYANASTTLKSIKEEISNLINRVDQELQIINVETNDFVFEMKEAYLRNFEMNEALLVKQRLEETAKKKAAFEEKRKQQEAARKAKIEFETKKVVDAGVKKPIIQPPASPVKKESQPALHTVDFRVTATAEQLDLLKEFLKNNNIAYGPVPELKEAI